MPATEQPEQDFAALLKENRTALPFMTQEKLGERIGFDGTYIGKWENRERYPTSHDTTKQKAFEDAMAKAAIVLAEKAAMTKPEQEAFVRDFMEVWRRCGQQWREEHPPKERARSAIAQRSTGGTTTNEAPVKSSMQWWSRVWPYHRLPRRRFLAAGVGGLATVGIGVSVIWWISSHASSSPNPSSPRSTAIHMLRGHSTEVNAVAWSPDGKLIASGGRAPDDRVQIWNASSGRNIYSYTGHYNTVNTLAWSPNGKYIASGSGDVPRNGVNRDHYVHVWDVKTGKSAYIYENHLNSIHSVAWSPDSIHIVSGSTDRTLQVWEALTGKLKFKVNDAAPDRSIILSVAWSPDGRYLAYGDRGYNGGAHMVYVLDTRNAASVYTFVHHDADVYAVAWSPDSKYLVSGSADTTVQIWEALTGAIQVTYKGHSHTVSSVAWSPDSKYIVSGSWDQTAQTWNALSGDRILIYRGHSDRVNAVAWSPDSKYIASGSRDHTVQIWQAR